MEPFRPIPFLLLLLLGVLTAPPAAADLVPGLLSDFEDGTLQGWDPPNVDNTTNIANGGPEGVGDNYLEIAPGTAGHIAAVNSQVAGAIDPAVLAVEVDMRRPAGQGALPVRIALISTPLDPLEPDDRWTSTLSQSVPDDGVWRTYGFSLLEADLTHVKGPGTWADIQADLGRLMIRHDPGAPSSVGTSGTGVLDIDNVFIVPEPGAAPTALAALATLAWLRRRRPAAGIDPAASRPRTARAAPSRHRASRQSGSSEKSSIIGRITSSSR